VWDAIFVKRKKLELVNFFSINNLDIAAITETKVAPKHRYSMSGNCVYRADRNQFSGGVVLVVNNHVCHDQFVLTNVVNLETIAVCLYLQNNI